MTVTATTQLSSDTTDLSEKYEELDGTGPEPYATFSALKQRVKLHYDLASDYYLSLWGEHIHHGYFTTQGETKEQAQISLINLLLDISSLTPSPSPPSFSNPSSPALRILDVGCGVGGTTRHLARTLGAHVTGITISTRQVELAKRLSLKDSQLEREDADGSIPLGHKGGRVTFIELDAEKMGDYFSSAKGTFDAVWISEALSHFPNKPLFFQNAQRVLKEGGGGKLVLADWFKDEGLSQKAFDDDIKPIEEGMLLPPLCVQREYVQMAEQAGLKLRGGPKDISKEVAKTWDISWSLIQSPSLWAFAFSQGRDGIAFLQSFRAMRRGYANGAFRYAVMAFEK